MGSRSTIASRLPLPNVRWVYCLCNVTPTEITSCHMPSLKHHPWRSQGSWSMQSGNCATCNYKVVKSSFMEWKFPKMTCICDCRSTASCFKMMGANLFAQGFGFENPKNMHMLCACDCWSIDVSWLKIMPGSLRNIVFEDTSWRSTSR